MKQWPRGENYRSTTSIRSGKKMDGAASKRKKRPASLRRWPKSDGDAPKWCELILVFSTVDGWWACPAFDFYPIYIYLYCIQANSISSWLCYVLFAGFAGVPINPARESGRLLSTRNHLSYASGSIYSFALSWRPESRNDLVRNSLMMCNKTKREQRVVL